jgi:hypothetical protein
MLNYYHFISAILAMMVPDSYSLGIGHIIMNADPLILPSRDIANSVIDDCLRNYE